MRQEAAYLFSIVQHMSGHTEDAIAHHNVVESGAKLLQKPITPASVLRRVRETLDE